MKQVISIAFPILFTCAFASFSQNIVPGHSHNDYENDNPLLLALENGFISIEADVHLINGELYVSHSRPVVPKSEKTLKRLYLDPLKSIIEQNQGQIYPDYTDPLLLMIDFKSSASGSYEILRTQLLEYQNMLYHQRSNTVINGPVRVFISGNRPIYQLLSDTLKLMSIDGRFSDLGKGFSKSIMPVVSESFTSHFLWRGKRKMPDVEYVKLLNAVTAVHLEDKKIRFWASPDNACAWKTLLDSKVDLINTDNIVGFHEFYHNYK